VALRRYLALASLLAAAGCGGLLAPQPPFPRETWRNGLGMQFVRIPAGEFVMGTSDDDVKALLARFGAAAVRLDRIAAEKPAHGVRVTRGFLMARHEVTVALFRRFAEATDYKTDAERLGGSMAYTGADWEKRPEATWRSPEFPQADDHPVVCVSWNDAQKFLAWLNAADGARPKGWAYRLPTEAEWEWAARGPERREWAWGNDWDAARCNFADKQSALAWADPKADDGCARTAPVGHYSPKGDTPQGVADLTGNVWEWCQDWFDAAYYRRSPAADPVNTAESRRRAERGGSWAFTADYCRAAFRMGLDPAESYDTLGLRVVLAPAP